MNYKERKLSTVLQVLKEHKTDKLTIKQWVILVNDELPESIKINTKELYHLFNKLRTQGYDIIKKMWYSSNHCERFYTYNGKRK